MEDKLAMPANRVLAVGYGANDICLLRGPGQGIAFEPKNLMWNGPPDMRSGAA